jgi:hypothetical protein
MPLSAHVWSLPDVTLARCVHPGLERLVEEAVIAGMPMLGNVDLYDDTRFNRLQVKLVVRELDDLLKGGRGDVAVAAQELRDMTQLVLAKPHRYLVFIGD